MSGKNKQAELPSEEAVLAERERLRARERYMRPVRTAGYILLVVAAVGVLISCAFLPVVQIRGDSMEPVLENNDIVLVLKTDRFDTGDLICFNWNNKTLLKRVIGNSGDWIDMDEEGNVFLNGEFLEEPYITEPGLGECDADLPVQVGENSYWVMGDKRASSIDSRSSLVGPVLKEQVIGKVVFKIWPLTGLI